MTHSNRGKCIRSTSRTRFLSCEALEDRRMLVGTMIGLGSLSSTDNISEAYGVSGDGEVIVGYAAGDGISAFRHTEIDGMQSLGVPGIAHAANYDGSTIVGRTQPIGGGVSQPFIWRESDDLHFRERPQGFRETDLAIKKALREVGC